MALFIRSVLCLAVIFYFNAVTADFAVAANNNLEDRVTTHEPKTRVSTLKDLPKEKGGKWLWALLGVAAVAGGVAAAAGGGSSGGGGDDDGGDSTGSVGGSW